MVWARENLPIGCVGQLKEPPEQAATANIVKLPVMAMAWIDRPDVVGMRVFSCNGTAGICRKGIWKKGGVPKVVTGCTAQFKGVFSTPPLNVGLQYRLTARQRKVQPHPP